jgi:hypothetical protein
MRKYLITVAAAASALAIAAPAAAQYYPAPQGYGYNNGYNGHNGYNNRGSSYRALQARIDRLQYQIRDLDQRNLLTNRQAAQRFEQSRIIERQLRNLSRNGLSRQEAYNLERGIADFERQVWRDTNNGRGWGRNNWNDRDRDGRNDRWEDDRGRDHDGRWDRDDD